MATIAQVLKYLESLPQNTLVPHPAEFWDQYLYELKRTPFVVEQPVEPKPVEMSTRVVKYHKSNRDIAVLLSKGEYWIGVYSQHLTHQNGEPPYVIYEGYWGTLEEAVNSLDSMVGDEFI